MKILVTGNMGYVGPGVVAQLRASYPQAVLVGYDIGFFANNLTNAQVFPECLLDQQHFTRNLLDALRDCIAVNGA